jgi:hypothetical protein
LIRILHGFLIFNAKGSLPHRSREASPRRRAEAGLHHEERQV